MAERRNIKAFTLMEVMIAATILAMSVAAVMAIVSGARSTLLRAEKRWTRAHILAQATEGYLLVGPGKALPEGTLPEGYTSSCDVYQVEEDIHEEALEAIREWILCEYHITIYDRDGIAIAQNYVHKVLKEEDLE